MARKARTLAKKFSLEFMARNPNERLTEADLMVLNNIETKKVIPVSLIAQRNSSFVAKETQLIDSQIKELEEKKAALVH